MKDFLINLLNFCTNLISAFGLLWLLIKIADYFGGTEISNFLKQIWWVFLIIGLSYAIIKQIPKQKFSLKIPNRDAVLNIVKTDIFKLKGSIIVPVNNHFKIDQDGNLLKTKSVLSQVVKRYYNNFPQHLQSDINDKLEDNYYNSYKENGHYKIGTVVQLNHNTRKFYFLANTELNQFNKSSCNSEIFEKSLNELWLFLADCAGKEDFIIPLIGTGNGRLKIHREIVFKEILLSFLSSLSLKNYAESLTICFNKSDVKKHNINFSSIGKLAEAKVNYLEFRNRDVSGSNHM